jgi:hypothetical protein
MPKIGDNDVLEQIYMPKLGGLLASRGILLEYKIDRAAIDIGAHLWVVGADGSKDVSGSRVWFQAKGLHASTVTLDEYEKSDTITTPSLELDHIRYWYNAPEPVYLALYVESADEFLAADVRELVDLRGGLASLGEPDQQTTTFKLSKTETFERALERMPRHRSMRIDGPAWRGRPLGHGFDPLRSALAPMDPELFVDVVSGLLAAHELRTDRPVQPLRDALSVDQATVLQGRLHLTYEWVLPMTTEFGYDEGSEFRIEGAPLHAQGDVLVVIDPTGLATPETLGVDLAALAKAAGTVRVLVMANAHYPPKQFGQWFAGLRTMGLRCEPQDLQSLTFNVLTTTNVFVEFNSRLALDYVNYLPS